MNIRESILADAMKALDEAEKVLKDYHSTPEQVGHASALCTIARSELSIAMRCALVMETTETMQ